MLYFYFLFRFVSLARSYAHFHLLSLSALFFLFLSYNHKDRRTHINKKGSSGDFTLDGIKTMSLTHLDSWKYSRLFAVSKQFRGHLSATQTRAKVPFLAKFAGKRESTSSGQIANKLEIRFSHFISVYRRKFVSFSFHCFASDQIDWYFSWWHWNRSMFNKLASDKGKVSHRVKRRRRRMSQQFTLTHTQKAIDQSNILMRCAEWCRCWSWYTCVHKIKRHTIYSLIELQIAMLTRKMGNFFTFKRMFRILHVQNDVFDAVLLSQSVFCWVLNSLELRL